MGFFRCVTRVGLVILLIAVPDLALCECIFGPNNVAQLVRRNNTIIGIMNDTLVNYTAVIDAAVDIDKNYPGYSVSRYLQSQYKTTPANYLDFVSMGKLLAIDWYTVATTLDASDPQGISSYINTSYTVPLHTKLQDIAVLYSFSLGIFRPRNLQYNFTVIKNDSTVTGNSSLDNSCIAGTYFHWQISTDLPYSTSFNNTRSVEFASLASMLENAFNEYYRRNTSPLNTEFVRANLIHANGSNSKVTAYMETYFFGYYHEIQNITNLTSLAGLQAMWYNGGVTRIIVTLSINSTFITSASHPSINTIPSTSTSSTQTMTTITVAQITNLLTEQTTIGGPVSTASTSTSLPSSITSPSGTTIPTTPSTTSYPSTLATSTATPSDPALIASTSSSALSPTMTPIQMTQTPNTSSYSSSLFSSPASITLTSNAPSLIGDSQTTMLTSPMSTKSSVPTNYTDRMTQTVGPTNETTMSSVSSSNSQNSSITLQNPWTSSSIMADLMNTSKTSQTTQSSKIIDNLTTINVTNGLLSSNSSTFAAVSRNQTGNTGITGNQTGNISRSDNGGTTFDPDPLFKANVPVITKVYNDEFLLKTKIGTMTPITLKATFMSITIPTAIGIIAATISCMLCLQIDCLWRGNKI